MIYKDLPYAFFPYVSRVIAEGLCLAMGIAWLLRGASVAVFTRYWSMFAYMAVLFVVAPFTRYPVFVLLQAASLFSVILYFISYHETQRKRGVLGQGEVLRYVIATYAVVVIGSLLLAILRPALAYQTIFVGDPVGYETRFAGLYTGAGAMAQASGLLLGLSAVAVRRLPIKVGLVAVAAVALFLTGSRSFWIGAVIGGMVTLWIYFPQWRRRTVIAVLLCVAGASVYYISGQRIDQATVARVTRADSITNFNGRTYLWDQAMKGIGESPWFGFGFTLGSTGMRENNLSDSWTAGLVEDPRQLAKVTLHNGYIQSLMDSGVIGTFFYIWTIVLALSRMIRLDKNREHPAALYTLLFFNISSFGESIISSVAGFPGIYFWACVIFALSLKESRMSKAPTASGRLPRTMMTAQPFPNLLR
jgi:O-antigen ligase